MKKWFEDHLILVWAIGSVLFALIVHLLFSYPVPYAWLTAKWSAGDILTYVSTVSLGLLAVWQNKRFKEENSRSQERLEKLSAQANELSVISKIIQYETENLSRLKEAIDAFTVACDPQMMGISLSRSSTDELQLIAALASCEKSIDHAFFKLARELRIDPTVKKDDEKPIKLIVVAYYTAAKKFVNEFNNETSEAITNNRKVLRQLRYDFLGASEQYLIQKETRLDHVIYGSMSMQDIQKLYEHDG